MSFRVVNISKPLISSSSKTIIQSIQEPPKTLAEMIKAGDTVYAYDGTYNEDVIVPNGVNLIGSHNVVVNGNVTLLGEGTLSYIKCKKLTVIGKSAIKNCIVDNLVCEKSEIGTFADCSNVYISKGVILTSSHLSLKMSTVSSELLALDLRDASVCLLEGSIVNGICKLRSECVIDVKNTSVVATTSKDKGIFDCDLNSHLQLFTCVITGNGTSLIKSGNGTSVRSNIIALGEATTFIGGSNTKLTTV